MRQKRLYLFLEPPFKIPDLYPTHCCKTPLSRTHAKECGCWNEREGCPPPSRTHVKECGCWNERECGNHGIILHLCILRNCIIVHVHC